LTEVLSQLSGVEEVGKGVRATEDENIVAVRFRGNVMEILLSSVAKAEEAEVKVVVVVGVSVIGTGELERRTVEVLQHVKGILFLE
jgi:hypothetical protein